jgi:hypothetical protein
LFDAYYYSTTKTSPAGLLLVYSVAFKRTHPSCAGGL